MPVFSYRSHHLDLKHRALHFIPTMMCLSFHVYCTILTIIAVGAYAGDEPRVAVAQLFNSQNVSGSITFTEVENGVRVTANITGMPAGAYGFHIHELGDISTCLETGAHFDLEGNNHGGPDHDVRHIGDLGNVHFVANESEPLANFDRVDTLISLRGRNSILGRAVVLHEEEDDLGKGGNEGSLTTGNAGARVACGVIGIKSPATAWDNSSLAIGPSAVLTFLLISVLFYFKE